MARLGYEAGRTPLVELLLSRRTLTDARLSVVDARLARVAAYASLAVASGQIAFGDIDGGRPRERRSQRQCAGGGGGSSGSRDSQGVSCRCRDLGGARHFRAGSGEYHRIGFGRGNPRW
ncbi:hypothetical protein G6F59_015823 [Rhizopus arrhizus]|nr:hypothetical protein G6F59_015823 [Rhizopus arrhizus]